MDTAEPFKSGGGLGHLAKASECCAYVRTPHAAAKTRTTVGIRKGNFTTIHLRGRRDRATSLPDSNRSSSFHRCVRRACAVHMSLTLKRCELYLKKGPLLAVHIWCGGCRKSSSTPALHGNRTSSPRHLVSFLC